MTFVPTPRLGKKRSKNIVSWPEMNVWSADIDRFDEEVARSLAIVARQIALITINSTETGALVPHSDTHLPNGSDAITVGVPVDIGSTNDSGSANKLVRSDHVHQGVHSIMKTGASELYSDVTLTEGNSMLLTQAGQDIDVAVDIDAGWSTQTSNVLIRNPSSDLRNVVTPTGTLKLGLRVNGNIGINADPIATYSSDYSGIWFDDTAISHSIMADSTSASWRISGNVVYNGTISAISDNTQDGFDWLLGLSGGLDNYKGTASGGDGRARAAMRWRSGAASVDGKGYSGRFTFGKIFTTGGAVQLETTYDPRIESYVDAGIDGGGTCGILSVCGSGTAATTNNIGIPIIAAQTSTGNSGLRVIRGTYNVDRTVIIPTGALDIYVETEANGAASIITTNKDGLKLGVTGMSSWPSANSYDFGVQIDQKLQFADQNPGNDRRLVCNASLIRATNNLDAEGAYISAASIEAGTFLRIDGSLAGAVGSRQDFKAKGIDVSHDGYTTGVKFGTVVTQYISNGTYFPAGKITFLFDAGGQIIMDQTGIDFSLGNGEIVLGSGTGSNMVLDADKLDWTGSATSTVHDIKPVEGIRITNSETLAYVPALLHVASANNPVGRTVIGAGTIAKTYFSVYCTNTAGSSGVGTFISGSGLMITDGPASAKGWDFDTGGAVTTGDVYDFSNNGTSLFAWEHTGLNFHVKGAAEIDGVMLASSIGVGGAPTTAFHLLGTSSADYATVDTGIDLNYVAKPENTDYSGVAAGGAGNLPLGTYRYTVTYVTALGETNASTAGIAVATDAINEQIDLTIPVSADYRVTSRKIYRTVKNTSGIWNVYLLATVADNSTTLYRDNISDATLVASGGQIGLAYYRDNTTNAAILADGTSVMLMGSNSTIMGQNTSFNGRQSTLFGAQAGGSLTALSTNITAIGYQAVTSLSGAYASWVGVGYGALRFATTGNGLVGIGVDTLWYGQWGSVAVGLSAGKYHAGNYGVFVGQSAGVATSGTHGSGTGNVGVGRNALSALTTGAENVAVGYLAGDAITTGTRNITIGSNSSGALTTGDGNIVIGYNIDVSGAGVDDEINIGGVITGSIASGAEEITIAANKIGFFSTTPVTQPVDMGALTDSTGGTADGTVQAVAGSGDDATINNNFSDLISKINSVRTGLRALGLMA